MRSSFLATVAVLALAGPAMAGTRNVGSSPAPAQTYQEVALVDPSTGALGGLIGSTTGFVGYTETTANLAVSAATTPIYRAAPAWATRFGCRSFSTQAGSLYIQENVGGTGTVVTAGAAAPVGGVAADVSVVLRGSGSLYACLYFNSTTATTTFALSSSFTAN